MIPATGAAELTPGASQVPSRQEIEPGNTVGFDTRDAADLHYTPRDRRRHKPAGHKTRWLLVAYLHRPAVDTASGAAYGTGREGGGDHGA
jgi:hypothetical protein